MKEFVVTQRLKSLPIYIEYFIILLGINLLIIMGVSIEAYFVDGKNLTQSFTFSYFTNMMTDKGYVLQIYRYANLLISEDVYNNITITKSQFEHVGALELKGKENKVDVYKWMQS